MVRYFDRLDLLAMAILTKEAQLSMVLYFLDYNNILAME